MMVLSLVAIQCLSLPRRSCRMVALQVEMRSQQCSSQAKETLPITSSGVVCCTAAKLDRRAVVCQHQSPATNTRVG